MQFLDLEVSADLGITFAAFAGLSLLSLRQIITASRSRLRSDWLIDLAGLFIQGLIVPVLVTFALLPVFKQLAPGLIWSVEINWWISLLLPLTLVDYLYYWNHRLLHLAGLWPLHRVHHSAKNMDILVTSRNSLFTPLFIVYIWIHPVFLCILEEWKAYLIGVAISSSLDLWRHSGLETPPYFKFLRHFLILPEEHTKHHSDAGIGKNYGANLSIWDKFHGTYQLSNTHEMRLGEKLTDTQLRHLFLEPWEKPASLHQYHREDNFL